jgi:GTP-binding protein EngB required for normal cell division
MDNATEYLKKLQPWYRQIVRKFLERQQLHEKVASLDKDLKTLEEQARKIAKPIPVCFLGSSGVGKSTLINAVVAGNSFVVPSGGIGPLTARELRIEFGEQQMLSVGYHKPKQIWRLLFSLQQMFSDELSTQGLPREPDDVARVLDDDDRLEIESTSSSESVQGLSKAETYRKLATLIVTGDQDSDVPLPYVADCLREVIGKDRVFKTQPRETDFSRIRHLKNIFSNRDPNEPPCFECSAAEDDFSQAVADHATGFLAPLVLELDIQWNSELLRNGVQIVDLPGLGVAGDVYRQVTDEWIRKKAQIVVLTVDSRGIRESDADLLKTSGFLTRFLHAADDPNSDPVRLVIGVVKIDDIAEEKRLKDKSKKKLEHFLEIQQDARQKLTHQLKDRLREAWADDANSISQGTKLEIINRLASSTPIFPLSAIQFRQLLEGDEDSHPFIKTLSESGVPAFIDGLIAASHELQKERNLRFSERMDLFDQEVRSQLRVIQARLGEAQATSEQVIRIKEELDCFLPPLREGLRARQGQFRGYLKETLPVRIEALVSDARIAAAKDLKGYLRRIKDVHWATLRAAVRRGGTYQGSRHIELPRDFAQALEEPIAEIWGKKILKEVREQTKSFADDLAAIVEKVVDWCGQHSKVLNQEVVDAQLEAIRLDSRKLTTVGKEMVDDLREAVRERLLKAIEDPIRRRCQAFVRKNADVGPGVKYRMHELLDDLLEESLNAAVPAAQQILSENYQEVEREIRKVFTQHHDPIKAVVDTFLEKFEARENKEEQKRRRAVLRDLEAVMSEAPSAA